MYRVSEAMFYRRTVTQLNNMRYQEFLLNAQGSSGVRVNAPNVDAVASVSNQASHRLLNEITQYYRNNGTARDWLRQADSSMQSMSSTLSEAKERAEQMATGTYSNEQREMVATYAEGFFEFLVNLANAQVDNKYIFAGTDNDNPAASFELITETPAEVLNLAGGTGRLYGQGTYTGLYSRSINLQVVSAPPITTPPTEVSQTNPLVLDYSYYDDYGRLKSGQVTLTGTGSANGIDVGDGVQIYAEPLVTYGEGAEFTLEIKRYRGNEEIVYGNMSWENAQPYSFILEDLFGKEGYTGTAVMQALAGANNSLASRGTLNVAGAHNILKDMGLEVQVGGPFQTGQNDQSLLAVRNYQFTVAGGFAGVPSPTNPMTVDYTWVDDGGVTQNGTLTITGTGPEAAVVLDPPGEATSFYVANGPFTGGQTFQFEPYLEHSTPTASNPMPVTYSYTDQNGDRQWNTIYVTSSEVPVSLNPPGGGITLNFSTGGFAAGDSWKVEERLQNADWQSLLDLAQGWMDALAKDSKEQPFFEAVAGINNNPASRGNFQVEGEWNDLGKRGYEFNIGGIAQTNQADQALLAANNYQFTVDASYAGGVPSRENPMVVNYTYNGGSGTVIFTGAGPEHAVNLEPGGEGTQLYLANMDYAPGQTFSFHTGYNPNLPVSAANPMPVTYTYRGDDGVRYSETVMVTDMDSSITLLPDSANALTFATGSRFYYNDSFNLTLEQYNQGQRVSQEFLEKVAIGQANLLRYNGEAGARLNNIDARIQVFELDTLRLNERLTNLEDIDVTKVAVDYKTVQMLYEATLQISATIRSTSLADYL